MLTKANRAGVATGPDVSTLPQSS
ncbi:hypothetical protein BO1005MUT1_180140 [Hyphomicrobiales bacterium]|nr:hypothetical protein BO1005MUT1_180140 [Hyphomicrobiales bacterium]